MATEKLTTCLHLRSKEMYYEDLSEAERDDKDDAAMYWCECTQTGVVRTACRRTGLHVVGERASAS